MMKYKINDDVINLNELMQRATEALAHQSFAANKVMQGVADGLAHMAAQQSLTVNKIIQDVTGGLAQAIAHHDSAVNKAMLGVAEGLAQAIAHQDVTASYEKTLKDWSQTFKGINECDFSEVLKASQVVASNVLDAESLSTSLNASNLHNETKDSLPQRAADGENLQGNDELSLEDIEFISAEVLNFSSAISERESNWQHKLSASIERAQKKNPILSAILIYIIFVLVIPNFANRGIDALIVKYCSIKDSPTGQAQVIDNVTLNTNVIIINSAPYYHEVYVFDEENKLCKQGWVAKKNVQILKMENK